jgi:ribosome biogenesis GTPase A
VFLKGDEEVEAQAPSIQWFPGHMAKTRRLMKENLRLVDIVVELRDARIPYSSQNPEIRKLVSGKPRALLLNKSDMADETKTRRWCAYYKEKGIPVLAVDCRSGKGLKSFSPFISDALADLLARRKDRGMSGRPVRLMIVGVPNVGKSSLINRLAGGKKAKVEDRPGVTRSKQWVKVAGGMELLDMPGVLWPKFEDPIVGENLAFTGAVKDDIIDIEALAVRLLERLSGLYPNLLAARYALADSEMDGDGFALLSRIGEKRGMLLPGGAINTERAAIMLLDEYRAGQIGRITLEDVASQKP